MIEQQTPKPEAQLPEATPPSAVHSSAVLQTPCDLVVEVVVHSLFGKVTTENNENAPENKLFLIQQILRRYVKSFKRILIHIDNINVNRKLILPLFSLAGIAEATVTTQSNRAIHIIIVLL